MRTLRIVVVALAVFLTWGLHAADRKGPEVGQEPDAAMQEAMKRGAPGEHHKTLEPFAGRFITISRIWMKPGEAPLDTKGKMESNWVLGDRFLKMDFSGDIAGQTFKSVGYLGYDNIREEYTGVWLDNMKTGITQSTGRFDSETQTYTETGTFSCPMTGEKHMKYRGVWQIVDRNTLFYTVYHPGPDGKEITAMEMTCSRVR